MMSEAANTAIALSMLFSVVGLIILLAVMVYLDNTRK